MRLLLVLASLISTLLFVSAKKSIGELLAVHFNNSNFSSIPDHPALWDLLRLPKDAIADSEIFHVLGRMFDFEDDRWILKWLLEHADTTDKEWIEIINMKYAKTQLRHGLKVRNHALVRNILQNHYKQSKWAVSYDYNTSEVKDYANYLLNRFEIEKGSSEIVRDFHYYCKEFMDFHYLFMSPQGSAKLLAGILKFILKIDWFYLLLTNGISKEDLSIVYNSKETMLKVHSRNAEVVVKVSRNNENEKIKMHLELLGLVNDILFLPQSSHKTEMILKKIENLDLNILRQFVPFYLGKQPFLHHSAINSDEPEIFEAIKKKFPIPRSSNGFFYMSYHGPKFNCFERLPDEQLMKYFHFYAPMFRNLTNAGIDKADAYAFSRNYKFEAAKVSFRLFNGGLPNSIGNGRAELLMTNLKYLLGTLDVPVDRLFEFVSENKEVLKKRSIDINLDRFIEILEYKKDSIIELFRILKQKEIDLVLTASEDENKRFKHLNFILDSDSGFKLLMKYRSSLIDILLFNMVKAIDGLPIHKVRRFFQFVGATVTGCGGPEPEDKPELWYTNIKISQLSKYFKLKYDILPYMALTIADNFESTYAFTSLGMNLGLFEIWFKENPESMLLSGTLLLLQHMKHRFTPQQIEAVRMKFPSDSYCLINMNRVFS